jgi:hypothetical protein
MRASILSSLMAPLLLTASLCIVARAGHSAKLRDTPDIFPPPFTAWH